MALVASNGGIYPTADRDLTVNELLLAYWKHAETYYLGPDGKPAEVSSFPTRAAGGEALRVRRANPRQQAGTLAAPRRAGVD